jgi:Glycosyl transferase family 2
MLPFFFRHYDDIVDRYFVFDNGSTDGSLTLLEQHRRVEISHFDVPGDSFVEEERRLADTIWRNSDADWVIITEIDEHIYHPHLTEYLRRCTDQGVTAIRSIGYEMVADYFPSGTQPLVEQVTIGARSLPHDRLCIFNPRELRETNFGLGRHTAEPAGRVVWPAYREVLLLHYKGLGISYLITRSAELRLGLRERDLAEGWGVHYTWSPAEIAAKWQAVTAKAGPVPGLGILRHIEPAKYFEEERIVEQSGLFDGDWYLAAYPDVQATLCAPVIRADALSHYCAHGWREGRQPNFYFNPEWYCTNYPELRTAGRNPLFDYVELGEKEGTRPSPLFDTNWYRAQHGLGIGESPLSHYLMRRMSGLVSPLPDFDVREYCQSHPEILTRDEDPFENYSKRKRKSRPQPITVTRSKSGNCEKKKRKRRRQL